MMGHSAKTSAASLEQECERMRLPREFVRQNPGFRAVLMISLILEPLARWFAPAWKQFSDEQLTEICFGGKDCPEFFVSSPVNFPPTLLWRALLLSIPYELARRMLLAENQGAGLLRKLVARGALSEEELARLQATAGLGRYNPNEFGDSKEENRSIFNVAVMEMLGETAIPSAASKEGLLKYVRGYFNSLPSKADNVLHAEVEKAQRRSGLRAVPPGNREAEAEFTGDSEQEMELLRPRQWGDWKIEYARDFERPVLLREIHSLLSTVATERERQVIELTRQGLSQEEVASRLDVSQARVSQLESSAIEKIRKAIGPS